MRDELRALFNEELGAVVQVAWPTAVPSNSC